MNIVVMTLSISTCNQVLSLPELEDVPIEDWHEYEHVQGDPVCKSPDEVPGQKGGLLVGCVIGCIDGVPEMAC